MPGIIVAITQGLKTNRTAAVIISGIVPLVLNLVLQTVSFLIQRKINKASLAKVAVDLSEPSCCGNEAILFLIPARSSILELIFVIILTGVYGALQAYFIHQTTLDYLVSFDQQNTCYIITVITVFFSSYSLFSQPIPESTVYLTNDRFSIFSNHYQRVGYSLIITACVCITEFGA